MGKHYNANLANLANTQSIKEFMTSEFSSTLKTKGATVEAGSLSSKFSIPGS